MIQRADGTWHIINRILSCVNITAGLAHSPPIPIHNSQSLPFVPPACPGKRRASAPRLSPGFCSSRLTSLALSSRPQWRGFKFEILFPQFFSTPTATQSHPTLRCLCEGWVFLDCSFLCLLLSPYNLKFPI